MANADTPFGLKLVGHAYAGSPYNCRVRPYYMPSTDESNVFIGDPVIKTSAGSNTSRVSVIGGEFPIGTLPTCDLSLGADTDLITGVCVGVMPTNRDSAIYGVADTERVLLICDDPFALYEIQADGAIEASTIGLNGILIQTHSGSATTGVSGQELDTTSTAPSADASNPFTIVAMVNRPDNTPDLIHNKVLVRINQSTEVTLGQIGI